MKKTLLKFLLFSFLTLPINVWGITVTGRVLDDNGDGALGAYVVAEKHTDKTNGKTVSNNGAMVESDGSFTLNNVEEGANLEISLVGYETQNVSAKENMGTIYLSPSTDQLDASTVTANASCDGKKIKHATNIKFNSGLATCVPETCEYPYEPVLDTCKLIPSRPCDKPPLNSSLSHYQEDDNGNLVCVIDECMPGFAKPTNNKCDTCDATHIKQRNKCVDKNGTSCTVDNKTGKPNAIYKCDNTTCSCQVDSCGDTRYKPDADKTKCVLLTGECSNPPKHAAETHYAEDADGNPYCHVDKCDSGFKPNSTTYKSCVKIDKDCTTEQKQKIKHGTNFEHRGTEDACYVLDCECGYKPNSDGLSCVAWDDNDKKCSSTGATKAEYTCDSNGKQICTVIACDITQYTFDEQNKECVRKSDKCNPEPAHSKKSHREWDGQKDICIIDECVKDYHIDDGKCVPDKTYTAEEIADLEAKTKAAKDTEQSLKNRLLGGATMVATGIGGMELARGLAEQSTDKAANDDMTAYLATFKCEYGTNKADGGETENELPGANTLFALYNEYQQLASDLQGTKEALGMTPGIESQVVLDKAATGLYDDMATGKTNGTFASLSRAINDSESADAAQIADEQSKSKSRVTGGAIAAGAGVAAGVTGNVLLNKVDWNAKKNKESPKQ
ncbi:MAG: hypothetical protein KBS86_01890 [Proteobacteria bacterium]|nr:hypothetical protein [Candidatus Enterousia scatequi]